MVELASVEILRARVGEKGLISATFHRSTDGTRIFNYGQWESEEAFEDILTRKGFNPEKPYWEGVARNDFLLYRVVSQFIEDS